MAMAVSFGKIDITPPVGMPLAGYDVPTPRLATGTHRPLWARCTVFWDNGAPNVIVTADVLGFGPTFNQSVRALVEPLGVAKSDFVLTATHTHNSPVLTEPINPYILYNVAPAGLPQIQAYTDTLKAAIVTLVTTTLAAPRTDCTLDYKVLQSTVSFNREGLSYVEHDVSVLVARSLTGTPVAVLFGYGCHPVAAGVQTEYDPDYPGAAAKKIEDLSGCFAQFITGAAGDQDPNVGARTFTSSDAFGATLGQAVVTSLSTVGRVVTGPINSAYRDISLPLDITNTPPNVAAVRACFVTRMNAAGLTSYVGRHAQTMIAQIDAHTFATSVPLPLQVWKLAGTPILRMLFSGGELLSGYAVYLRSLYGGVNGIWVSAYANQVPAYIPSDESLFINPGPHYACGWTTDFPGIGGGAQGVYGWLGRFKGRAPGTTTTGVEQIMISNLTSMLA
jgi:neutral ceramidase